jgi:protein ImuA
MFRLRKRAVKSSRNLLLDRKGRVAESMRTKEEHNMEMAQSKGHLELVESVGSVSERASVSSRPSSQAQPSTLLSLGTPDAVLQGGLGLGELHELSPATSLHSGAALGFALALSVLHPASRGTIVFVQQDFAALETGMLSGLGCDAFGLDPARLLVVRASSPRDALWAMEEALKTRGIAAMIGELAEDGKAADLTATRRLSLAAQKCGGLALLLRQRPMPQPSAAATRWQVAAAPGSGDGFGGLARTGFRLSLTKNRRGACGSWILQWDHHGKRFLPALSVAVATPARDRSGDAAFAAAG